MTDHYLTPDSVSTSWQRFGLRALALFGWRVNVAPLQGPRGVLIVYPHTSNWDVVVGLFAKWALDIRVHWLVKDTLFRGVIGATLGRFLRACGAEPIERGSSTGAIKRLAQRINAADNYWLALAPEGTRKYRDTWRSGFYHIALTAGVPLGLVCWDYRRKEIRMVHFVTLTGDIDVDLARIRDAYREANGLRPEWASPIDFVVAERQEEGR